MTCSTDMHNIWRVAAIVILTAIVIPTSVAQQSPQDRYNRALKLFLSNGRGDAEEACDIMNQVVKDVPGNSQYQGAANSYCAQVRTMLNTERSLFNQGRQLAQNDNCPAAKADYQQMSSLPTRDDTYRNKLFTEVQNCESRTAAQRTLDVEQTSIDRASQLFQQGHDAQAKAILQPIASGAHPHAQQARQLLGQIDQKEQSENAAVNHAQVLISQNRNSDARVLLISVIHRGGPATQYARQLLQQIGTLPHDNNEETLREGIRAYFRGDLNTAEDDLTKYLGNPGNRAALAYFFRGATRCSSFYLSGETDINIKNSAVSDFKIVRQQYSTFTPPARFFSPKVLALYQAQ